MFGCDFSASTTALAKNGRNVRLTPSRSMIYLPLTYDHRLVDGADAGRFLTTVKQRLEEASFEADLGL